MHALIQRMEDHIRRQRNVILDRRDFYLRRQEAGERFDDFFMSLKEIGQFCDFCETCTDERFRDRILTGIRDEETVRLLLSEKNLTLGRTLDICRARENSIQDSAALTSTPAIRAMKQTSSREPGKRCGYCGGEWHVDLAKCPARRSKCDSCGRDGHFASVCRRTSARGGGPRGRSKSRRSPSARSTGSAARGRAGSASRAAALTT